MQTFEYIQCPSEHPLNSIENPTIFLAGGITNCPDWQTSLKTLLFSSKASNLTVFNPRRAESFDFSKENEWQIRWEFERLSRSDAVSFWFTKESVCPITLFELGTLMKTQGKRVFVGCHPEYSRKQDLLVQLKLYRPEIKLCLSLESLAEEINAWREEIQREKSKKSRGFAGNPQKVKFSEEFQGKIRKFFEILTVFVAGAALGWKLKGKN